ncbi:MAG: hypothetical protein H0Z34_15880 [Brevibacillus sp.]|nr:hypothetical protein [Brevibacillus sp.]
MKKKILQLFGMLFFFIMIVSLVDDLTNYGFLFSIVLVIVPFSLCSALVLKKVKRYLTVTIPHWKERTKRLSNYFFMFLSAGLFVDMVSQTKWVHELQNMLAHYADQTMLFYLFIAVYFVVTALVGFHPLVSFSLVINILQPMIEQVSSISFALVLISCSLATVMYSPFNVSVSLLSSEIKVNPYRITLWNFGFAMCYMWVSMGAAYFLHLLG